MSRPRSLVAGAVLLALASALVLSVRAAPPAEDKGPATKDQAPGTSDSLDLVFLDDARPVLLRLHVQIDGKPFGEVWDDFLAKMFKYFDRDGNGTLSKEEAERVPHVEHLLRLLRGETIYDYDLIFNGARRGNVTAKMADLDSNKDGKVTLEELKAYYAIRPVIAGRSVNVGAQPVTVMMGPNRGDSEALTEALFKHLDANKDGKLSKEELAAMPERLRRLDTDDDEMISVSELVPERFADQEGVVFAGVEGQGGNALGDGAPFVRIDRNTSADKLARRLMTQYDKNKDGKLSPKEIGLDAADFAALDKNKDGQLDLTELAAFAARTPDLELIYRLGKVPKGKGPGGLLKLALDFGPKAQGGEQRQPVELLSPDGKPRPLAGAITNGANGSLKLGLPAAQIVLLAAQSMAGNNNAGIKEFYIQQFKEAVGATGKKDFLERKGLEQTQYQYFASFFNFADRNGDNKLTEKELSDFLDLQMEGAAAVVTLTIHDLGRGLFELIDAAPRDGRLGLREMRTAWSRLAHLDRDGDGCIAKTEIPRQFRMAARQSGLNYPYQGFVVDVGYRTQTQAQAPTRGPAWFRKMDRNGDGDVSPREWLGSEEDFKKIDTDGDGLISADEAERYDALVKQQKG
jgi:Ca2+-binding EF-hand superfamily protein